jgi:hypothetical protein
VSAAYNTGWKAAEGIADGIRPWEEANRDMRMRWQLLYLMRTGAPAIVWRAWYASLEEVEQTWVREQVPVVIRTLRWEALQQMASQAAENLVRALRPALKAVEEVSQRLAGIFQPFASVFQEAATDSVYRVSAGGVTRRRGVSVD